MNFDIVLLLLLVPLLTPFILKLTIGGDRVTWGELGINLAVVFMFGLMAFAIGTYSMTADSMILNGKVTDKKQEWTSCSHSYSCNCRTVRSGNTTTTSCQTCYEHFNDWNWRVHTTVGSLNIARIDRQGSKEPPRWTAVKIGEPASVSSLYTNYIKGAPESLFHLRETLMNKYPHVSYPEIHDYYRVNRIINDGVYPAADAKRLNDLLNDSLRELGSAKQVNVVVAFTKNSNPEFAEAMRQDWLGGKKNDVVLVVGGSGATPEWVRVFSWSKNDIFNVVLRDSITSKDPQQIHDSIVKTVKESFVRRSMSEYEYLKDDISPPMWGMVLIFILNMLVSVGIYWVVHHNDFV